MIVAELLQANDTPYDEALIKFKDEGLAKFEPRKNTAKLGGIYLDLYLDMQVKSFWFEEVYERRKDRFTKFLVIVIK